MNNLSSTRFDRIVNDTETKTAEAPASGTEGPVVSFQAAFDKFLATAQTIINHHYKTRFPTLNVPTLTVEPGRRYWRIVRNDAPGSSRSVYCFIDSTNGDILKSESWKKPAKHARGNIFTSDIAKSINEYGANYMR